MVQVGADIDGEADQQDSFMLTVGGAIGAMNNDSGSNSGHVRIYGTMDPWTMEEILMGKDRSGRKSLDGSRVLLVQEMIR